MTVYYSKHCSRKLKRSYNLRESEKCCNLDCKNLVFLDHKIPVCLADMMRDVQ
jgi:hypothetical protein